MNEYSSFIQMDPNLCSENSLTFRLQIINKIKYKDNITDANTELFNEEDQS